MDMISVDINYINKLKLNVNEYLTLLKINNHQKGITIPFDVTDKELNSLITKGFLVEETFKDNTELSFTAKASALFDTTDELFKQFYNIFPNRIPNGLGGYRPVSTLDANSMSAKATKKIWNKLTKGNTALQLTIISGLTKELESRKSSGTLMYLSNIDTWLRQYSWEKWDSTEKDNLLRGDVNEKML